MYSETLLDGQEPFRAADSHSPDEVALPIVEASFEAAQHHLPRSEGLNPLLHSAQLSLLDHHGAARIQDPPLSLVHCDPLAKDRSKR